MNEKLSNAQDAIRQAIEECIEAMRNHKKRIDKDTEDFVSILLALKHKPEPLT